MRHFPFFIIGTVLASVIYSSWSFTSSTSSSTPSKRLDSTSVFDSPDAAEKTYGKGAWKPPSHNKAQLKGKVFSIQQPQDLLDFVVEDERLSVVKVFASWCKTCQKFDLRYRKLANQHSDSFDAKSKTTKPGRVRFAEMQYDNPNNEEMCQLLNATKLPYIIMYKGSRGKVDEFQCGPGTFQVLIDKVNEYADSEDIAAAIPMFVNGDEIAKTNDMSEAGQQINPTKEVQFSATDKSPVSQNEEKLAQSKPMIPATDVEPIIQPTSDVESLKEQLVIANNEKIELFEVMKADLDWHKEQIKQLNDAIQSQRDQYEGLLRVRDGDLTRLEQILSEQKTQFEIKLTGLEDDVDKVSNALQQSQETVDTLESEVALWQQRAYEVAQSEDETNRLEQKVTMYENERNSLRKLSVLVVQRVWRAAGSLISRLKKI